MLITGGVHGYETSGVQGALLFLEQKAKHYSQHFNIFVGSLRQSLGLRNHPTMERTSRRSESFLQSRR